MHRTAEPFLAAAPSQPSVWDAQDPWRPAAAWPDADDDRGGDLLIAAPRVADELGEEQDVDESGSPADDNPPEGRRRPIEPM